MNITIVIDQSPTLSFARVWIWWILWLEWITNLIETSILTCDIEFKLHSHFEPYESFKEQNIIASVSFVLPFFLYIHTYIVRIPFQILIRWRTIAYLRSFSSFELLLFWYCKQTRVSKMKQTWSTWHVSHWTRRHCLIGSWIAKKSTKTKNTKLTQCITKTNREKC